MTSIEYLDAFKRHAGIESDYGAAKALGVTRQAVSAWRVSADFPSPLACYRLAEELGIDPAVVVAEVQRERAEKAGRADAAASWRRWLEKAAGAVAAVAGAVILSALGMVPQEAYASLGGGGSGGPLFDVGQAIHCRAWRRRRKSRRAAQHAAHAQAARAAADRSTL